MVMVAQVTKMNDKVTGFILKQSDYKDYSVILSVLTKEYGKLSLVANGVRKPTSKNAGRIIPYTKAEFLIDHKEDKTIFTIKNVSTIQTYKNMHMDLSLTTCCSVIGEITDTLVMSGEESEYYPEVYDSLEICFSLLEKKKDPITVLSLFCSDIMKYFGISADVDECVHCGSTYIKAISIKDGGFLCKECANQLGVHLLDNTSLKRFRLLCKGGLEHYQIIEDCGGATYEDLKILIEMIRTHTGIKMKSFGLFERLFAIE